MKLFKYLLTFSGLLLYSVVARNQVPSGANWHLVKEGNGIQVYTAPAPSGLKYIKVSAVMNGTLNKISSVFRDISRQKAWVYNARKSFMIRKINNNQLVYYNETALPWPVNNRDVAILMKLEEDPAQQTLTITQKEVSGAVPLHKGIVRVPHMSGIWKFQNADKGQLHAEYYLDIDPGGSLPAWVVNLFVTKGPYQTFIKLQKMINQ